jgi:CheY-like chemotaxis protein/HPt (histidine-containing phosphotransfer) domain-containing protein
MLTSGARPDDAHQLRQIGVNQLLMKPVKQSELFSAVIAALGEENLLSGSTQTSREPGNRENVGPLKILLAEDNKVNQKLALGILGSLGHHVSVANNGKEALQLLESGDFHLVLMDVQMPEMDGLSATREIRRRQNSIPVVAMTAHAMKGDREDCLAAGMNDYLTKPIRLQDMAAKLQEFFGAHSTVSPAPKPADSLPSGKSNSESIICWEHALRSTGGNEKLLREVVATFLDDAPRLLTAAEQAAARGDIEKLKHVAHSIKGSLLFLHSPAAFESAQQVEKFADGGQLDQARLALAEFRQRFEAVKHDVEKFANHPTQMCSDAVR